MTIKEWMAAPIEDVLAEFLERNEGVPPSIMADRMLSSLRLLGWKIERK